MGIRVSSTGRFSKNALATAVFECPVELGADLEIEDASIATIKLADGILSADSLGRGKMASNFFDATKAAAVFVAGAIPGSKLENDALAADATGRAKMANAFFNEATATAKFAAGAIVGTLLKAGALTADANGRAKFAAGIFDAATVASIFAASTITKSLLAADALGAANVIADPGNTTKVIPVTASGSISLTSAGASETRTLAIPTFAGQTLSLEHGVDAGDIAITAAARINQAANTVMTFTEVGDFIKLEAVTIGGALRWQVVANDGVVLS